MPDHFIYVAILQHVYGGVHNDILHPVNEIWGVHYTVDRAQAYVEQKVRERYGVVAVWEFTKPRPADEREDSSRPTRTWRNITKTDEGKGLRVEIAEYKVM